MGKKFKFTIDGKVYHANMIDNPLMEKIARMCPFEADYQRYTEHEYYTRLPERASAKGCEMTTMAYKNQVFYFERWNAFTILFGDCNTAPFEVVHLGDMVEEVAPQLKDAGAVDDEKYFKTIIDTYHGFINCFQNMKDAGIVLGLGAQAKGSIKENKAMERAYELGKLVK